MAGKGEGTGSLIQKLEETKVQMLKNKNKILKRFGKPGLKAYRGIVKGGVSLGELSEKSGIPEGELAEIVEFMEKAGIVEVSGEIPAKPAAGGEKKAAPPPREIPRPPAPAPPAAPPRPPASREEKPKPGARKPSGFEIKPISDEEIGEEEEAEEKKRKEEFRRQPPEVEPEEIAPPPEPPPRKPESKPPPGITPIEFEEKAPAPPREPPRAPREPPKEEPPPLPPEEEAVEEEPEEEFLTPSEKAIRERYGETGLLVYSYIDGQRTAEQIMRDAKVTEAQLIEILDFMEKKGIIRLEHPAKRGPPPPPPRAPPPRMPPPAMGPRPPAGPMPPPAVGTRPPAAMPPRAGAPPAQSPQAKSMFAPMVEEQHTVAGPISEKELAAISLDVPSKATKGNILLEVQAKAQTMLKFGKEYSRAYEMMDGTKDVVEVCVALKIPLHKLYEMLKFLQGMNAVALKPEPREDIRKRYGEDGYSVYKKYGREGVMLYQLIGKEMSLKEMAALTTTDPNRIIEMFMFIHKLLGIELPIDEDVLRERLGIQKKPPEPSQ